MQYLLLGDYSVNLITKRYPEMGQNTQKTDTTIDAEGYRPGVGIILVNSKRQVFLAKRIGKDAWQFPQGGIKTSETPEKAMFRELKEEIGLFEDDVKILAETQDWLHYRLPPQLIRRHSKPICIGQKQKWFLLRLINDEAKINLLATQTPEFDSWAWVSYWHPLKQVVWFKRNVYAQALKEFARFVLSRQFWKA
jgi:putative (di)nucleoside polyphosphate hydrolase